MAKKDAEKEKTVKVSKPKQGPPGDDKAKAKAKAKPDAAAEKQKAEAAAALEKEKELAKAAAAPRPPADPRLKVLKKFHGKFLPRGPLRDRHKALMARWDSGEDHGGVTAEELKSLYTDWKAARAKPAKKLAGASR